MAADGDLYQIIDQQQLDGQTVLNVYFYKRNAPVIVGNPAQAVADAFDGQVLPDILTIQSDALTHTALIVNNLFDASDTYTKVISEVGGSTGADSSPFDAIGFRLVQDNGSVRNGSKRYAGVLDEDSSSGIIDDTDLITELVTLGATLIGGVEIGIIANALTPIIVKRIKDGSKYRLPQNSGEAVYGNINNALYNIDVTSQVSRKIGRGE